MFLLYNKFMRKLFAIVLCKIAKKIGALFHRGSSLPGKIALKICPEILNRIKLPENIIAVTGSNGKTSTVEMIYHVLTDAGYRVAGNREGSNQIEGVTTLIIDHCNLRGVFQADILLLEVDERYAKHVFRYIVPKYYVINNLFRDQLTRNGSPEFVLEEIKRSIKDDSTLILNADDPLVASLGRLFENKVYYFGVNENQYVEEEATGPYDDGHYCPLCKSKMIYEYRQFAHIGKYKCLGCGFERPEPDFYISDIDLQSGRMTINGEYHLDLAYHTIFNAYNILAAFSIGRLLDVHVDSLIATLNEFLIHNGRIKRFKIGSKHGTLLISKHENSVSYNRNLAYVANYGRDVTLLLIVEDISRKYFTSDTSWLWDINFELLNSENIKMVICAGQYLNDIAIRLENAGVDMRKIILRRNVDSAIAYLRYEGIGECFAMTCFSDEAKLLKEVESYE